MMMMKIMYTMNKYLITMIYRKKKKKRRESKYDGELCDYYLFIFHNFLYSYINVIKHTSTPQIYSLCKKIYEAQRYL